MAPQISAHRRAYLASLGALLVVGGIVVGATFAAADTVKVGVRAIVRSVSTSANEISVDVTVSSPERSDLLGVPVRISLGSGTPLYRHTGKTAVGGAQQPVTKTRIRLANIIPGEEISIVGRHTAGSTQVRAVRVHVSDRKFVVCGVFRSITRRNSAGAGDDRLTVEPKTVTTQEARYASLFPKEKNVVSAFHGSTTFANADGSWKNPKNRRSLPSSDVTASDQNIRIEGKVTGGTTLEVDRADLGTKCT